MMIKPISSFPVIIVDDIISAKVFYIRHFDFDVVFENEWYIHLVSKSGIQIGFMLPNQPTQPKIFHNPHHKEGFIFSLEVEDADTAYTEAQSNSLNIVLELKSEDWGQRHFCIEDPNGVYLDIVQTFEPTEEYEKDYAQI